MKKIVSHISAVEQIIDESREAFIEVGCKRFRTKPTVAKAFGMFRTKHNYTKVTDALNECLEDALTVNGFLPQSTLEDVGLRERDALGMTGLALAHLIARYSEHIAECMQKNNCNQARAVEIIFELGAERGHHNGYRLREEASEGKQMVG